MTQPNYQQIRKDRILALWGREPQSLDELGNCTLAVLNNHPNVDRFSQARSSKKRVRVAGVKWDVQHSFRISNTHDCPINGVTNWGGRNEGAPNYYPGWQGRVWVRYAEPVHSFGNDPWEETLLHTGTGGWGSYDGPWTSIYNAHYRTYGHGKKVADMYPEPHPEPQVYSWDFRFFDEDWPELAEVKQLNQDTVWAVLGNQPTPPEPRHVFEWHDTEIQDQDRQFIERYMKSLKKKPDSAEKVI